MKIVVVRVFVLASFILLVACTQSPIAPHLNTPTSTPKQIASPIASQAALEQRPLHLPTLTPGRSCPTTHGHQVNPSLGLALGDGPAYPVGLGANGVLIYDNFFEDDSNWGGMKVLWAIRPEYQKPILVRGHQIDGPNIVLFNQDRSRELYFSIYDAGSWTNMPTYTRIRNPGCYAYQVDGPTFSKIIIFQAISARGN